jgi:hypothetical protein
MLIRSNLKRWLGSFADHKKGKNMITKTQLRKLKEGVDKVIYAGHRYRYLGMNENRLHIMIEDEPGHIDLVLPVNCSIPKKRTAKSA